MPPIEVEEDDDWKPSPWSIFAMRTTALAAALIGGACSIVAQYVFDAEGQSTFWIASIVAAVLIHGLRVRASRNR